MPIDFYGRVVDENEQPVFAAKIHAQWSDFSANGASSEDTLSDTQGYFSIRGKTGRGITIRIVKEGYYTPKLQRTSFDYAAFWERNYHQPDPTHPVIFHLRTKGRPEALSSGETTPIVPADGTPVLVDLLNNGRVSPNGQIEFAAVTNTEKYPPHTFDWRASITVRDGGLLEHNLEFPFEAPEEGYIPQVTFEMPADYPDWKRSIEKTYFIRFGNPPKYGRLQIRLNGASQKVLLHYTVNPTGSRNLEGQTDGAFATP
jgi:hypothetical protein